jgi:hypothetical protein
MSPMTNRLPICALWLALASTSSALTVQLDYTYDTSNFFANNPTAKATLEEAAKDVSDLLANTFLGAVPGDTYTGTSGGTTAKADWNLTFANPSDSSQTVTLNTFNLPANQFTIYVGAQHLGAGILGQGGISGAGNNPSATSTTGFAELPTAVSNMQSASNAVMPRGNGPVIGSLNGSIGSSNYTLKYGALVGSLTFDDDTNNDGVTDTSAQINNFWQLDYKSAVGASQYDFYSVALHEILHTLGFGTSDTWNSLRSGTTWLGGHADALNGGSGVGLLSSDFGHIADGKMSLRLSDGVLQEAVMDPTLANGMRKTFTQLDVAFLQDLGYTVVPEPSSVALLACSLLVIPFRRRQLPA